MSKNLLGERRNARERDVPKVLVEFNALDLWNNIYRASSSFKDFRKVLQQSRLLGGIHSCCPVLVSIHANADAVLRTHQVLAEICTLYQTYKISVFNDIRSQQIGVYPEAAADDPRFNLIGECLQSMVQIPFNAQAVLKKHVSGLGEAIVVFFAD